MAQNWTFGKWVGFGFALMIILVVIIGAISVNTLHGVVDAKNRVITVNAEALTNAAKLHAAFAEKAAASRGYLLARDRTLLDRMAQARAEFAAILAALKQTSTSNEGRQELNAIERLEADHELANQRIIELRSTSTSPEDVSTAFTNQVAPIALQTINTLNAFVEREERTLADASQAATAISDSAVNTLYLAVIVTIVFGVIVAVMLIRTLGHKIGESVGQVQNASTQLQAAANQQATGSKEQATAMNEITTTISELLATSRQIAESAQRVAQIAEQTAASARSGEGIVGKTQESMASIRRQVELIVSHMLELGKKSQQIGTVLDVVSELAEQTNILAINATIEAAGAGEAGKRFAVVAEEIRKLADRVTGSAKEIRELIEDVRGAVNTTVMATESGSKAVEAGAMQFGDVSATFKQIVTGVVTTTEAAREIQLSTKQQSTAVEQVNAAIVNVAQATRENEVSSEQTLQTASELTVMSKVLLRLVRSQAA